MRPLGSAITTAAILLALSPADGRAQWSGDGFLFRTPAWSLSLHAGLAVPRARSDVFSFTSEQLTVDRADFRSLALGIDVERHLVEGTHLVFSLDGARRAPNSEFREFIDNEDLPIEQTTKFARVNVSIGVKQYLMKPGRSIGRLAWVPARIAPFVGIGAGALRYDFHQYGDFIDFQTMEVFEAQFHSTGWTATAHGRGGVDLSLTPRIALTAQGRYDWAKAAKLSSDFLGFDRIDLTGFATTIGLTVRF
jgi:hypothetical protein